MVMRTKKGMINVQMNEGTLSELSPGEKCRVKELLTIGSIKRRLTDLGVIEGTEIECLQKSPWGDPTAYLIRGAVIAIRNDDSAKILIEQETKV